MEKVALPAEVADISAAPEMCESAKGLYPTPFFYEIHHKYVEKHQVWVGLSRQSASVETSNLYAFGTYFMNLVVSPPRHPALLQVKRTVEENRIQK